jgi:predicted RNA-binding protein with PUA-like domain
MQYWLLKTEPDVFSIEMLEALNGAAEPWSGVRNYLARNHMRSMQVGDLGLLYHSSCKVPGAAGVCRVVRTGVPDPTALDPQSDYFDPKSSPENVRWDMVDVAFVARFEPYVPLAALRADPFFTTMPLLARGQRLSVQPVEALHFARILDLGGVKL